MNNSNDSAQKSILNSNFQFQNSPKRFWFVYMLRCADDKPYTGYTKDLNDRLSRHNRGSVPSTKNRRPMELETFFAFSDQYQAIEFEKYLKSGSGRAVMNKRFYKRSIK